MYINILHTYFEYRVHGKGCIMNIQYEITIWGSTQVIAGQCKDSLAR